MSNLKQLASLLVRRNAIDEKITALIDRPAIRGHVGEWIAQEIFGVTLAEAATQKGFDGRFADGPLAGKTVNVKWYGKLERMLDIKPDADLDYYLVLTGPKATTVISRGQTRPWVIEDVFLLRCAGDGGAVQEADTQTSRRLLRAATRVGGSEGLSRGGGQTTTDANRFAARGAEAVR